MNSRFSRPLTALVLVSSLLATSIAVFSQTQTQTQPSQSQDQSAASQTAKTDQQPASTKPANTKPLSTNEDPAMIGKRNINKGIVASMSGSTEKEVRMGRELAAEVDRQAKFIDDPVVTEYINRVGQNIVLHSDAKIPFTIKVIDSDEINAFALPGGFFYVNKGLILAADNEAELAGVMAHEIAHVAARHAVENQTKATITQWAIMVPAIVLGGGIGEAIYQGGGFAALLGFMKFSRGAEEEADKLGTEYLYAAGYDPTAMASMFEKLEGLKKKKPGTIAKLFADHPAPADRRAASLALAARFPEHEEYVISSSEFQRVKARLMRLSNSRVSTAGDLQGGENGPPGRPTLKRRQPAPDDSTTTPTGPDQKPAEQKDSGPPKLKRNDPAKPSPSPEP